MLFPKTILAEFYDVLGVYKSDLIVLKYLVYKMYYERVYKKYS